MTEYVKNVTAHSDEYEKKRKRESEEAVALINQTAAEQAAAAAAETDAAIRAEQRAARDAVDEAAVQRMITVSQAKEKLAAMGLGDSGLAKATAHAAGVRESRAAATANRKRDAAVAALSEALARTEQTIEQKRAESVLRRETQDVTEDPADFTAGLLKAAYSAESRENVAKTKADSDERVAKTKADSEERVAAIKAKSEADKLAQKQQQQLTKDREEQRLLALKQLYTSHKITSEVYSQAIQKGWDVDKTLTRMEDLTVYRRVDAKAKELYYADGFDAMMRFLAPYNPTDERIDVLCHTLDISRKRVDEWMKGYRVFMESVPEGDWIDYYERKGASEFTAY